ncbi:hypothetical protein GGS23DRAFT_301543 [Durotheca rogersii]|uniref:uncharacterized protein n=1 Tax=Durotheca rogersii TaxID=419775 RepID=UPI00221F5B27|nr:uncharacterized protein GGS23DRAFT_301543 [Durotheca rogersii]KAI5867035.1 hypothetical protein GGS23DRAFT_301543 [Durotheca rogersii]
MPPRRNKRAPADVDPATISAADIELASDPDRKPGASIGQAMASIEKWKGKRTEVRKSIGEDYANTLAALKDKINAHHEEEMRKVSDHNKQQLERLVAAVEKRIDCEEKISKRIDTLRDDCAHIAMLVDAVYVGRKEAAVQVARAASGGSRKANEP